MHVAEGYLFSGSSRNSGNEYKIGKIIIQKIPACKNLVVYELFGGNLSC